MKFASASMLLFLALASGCATRTETFDVSVRNESKQDVVAWLTKVGGPEEEGWRTPESIAINFVVEDEELGGLVIPPGTTGRKQRKAKLDPDARAVLRVYQGRMKMSVMLATQKGSSRRADLLLRPGVNRFIVIDTPNELIVTRADGATTSPSR